MQHNYKHTDPISLRSLATRVCSQDMGIELSSGQQAAAIQLFAFLEENTLLFNLENGPVVMAVCCLLWLMNCVSEVTDTIRVACAVGSKMDTETAITEMDGELHVEAVSYARGCFFMAVQAVRLVIASTLLVAGQFFLMNTTSIGDMLVGAPLMHMHLTPI